MTPEEKHRFVKAAVSKMRIAQPRSQTDHEKLLDQTQRIVLAIRDHVKPILQAGGGHDEPALRALLTTLYIEAFHKVYNKDELVNLCALLHMELAMENIKANPWGSDKGPDALSGV